MSLAKTLEGDATIETIYMEMIICCNCAIPFMVGRGHRAFLRENHNTFYCPNGHPQSYTGLNEEERLKKQLEEQRKRHEKEQQELSNKLLDEMNTRKKAEQQLKRVHKGVCPCCNRSFINLQRHMKTKHPETNNK
jgi:C4-dicarboxylate-specific signal transduction histidine kinase